MSEDHTKTQQYGHSPLAGKTNRLVVPADTMNYDGTAFVFEVGPLGTRSLAPLAMGYRELDRFIGHLNTLSLRARAVREYREATRWLSELAAVLNLRIGGWIHEHVDTDRVPVIQTFNSGGGIYLVEVPLPDGYLWIDDGDGRLRVGFYPNGREDEGVCWDISNRNLREIIAAGQLNAHVRDIVNVIGVFYPGVLDGS